MLLNTQNFIVGAFERPSILMVDLPAPLVRNIVQQCDCLMAKAGYVHQKAILESEKRQKFFAYDKKLGTVIGLAIAIYPHIDTDDELVLTARAHRKNYCAVVLDMIFMKGREAARTTLEMYISSYVTTLEMDSVLRIDHPTWTIPETVMVKDFFTSLSSA